MTKKESDLIFEGELKDKATWLSPFVIPDQRVVLKEYTYMCLIKFVL